MPKQSKPKKSSLGGMKQTHAQLETVPQKLSQIIAAHNGEPLERNFGPYKTEDASTYSDYLSKLSRADLEAHCEKVGVIPAGDSSLIVRKLTLEFKKFWQGSVDLIKPVTFTQEQKDKFKNIKF